MSISVRAKIARDMAQAALPQPKWQRMPRVQLTMISITYPLITGEGIPVMISTWAVGADKATAFAAWRKKRMGSLPHGYEVKIVTESKKVIYEYNVPKGGLAAVRDELLERVHLKRDWNWRELLK